jgi:predicted DNA binding CopG/RHH family protein
MKMAKIPKFKDVKDMAEFWDSHSSSDYWETMEESGDTFSKPTLKPLCIKMDPNMLQKIKALSRRKGLTYNAYIRLLISQGLENELREIKKSA